MGILIVTQSAQLYFNAQGANPLIPHWISNTVTIVNGFLAILAAQLYKRGLYPTGTPKEP
jgi:hypothetical protein